MPGTGKTQVDPSRRRLAWYDRGPGPAGYTLPPLLGKKDHAVTHRINPEYTMRPKPPLNLPALGPGAGAYLIPQGLKARGWDKTPAFTMRIKTKNLQKPIGPGPAEHTLPVTDIYRHKPPKYSLRSRHGLIRRFQTPAPNAYALPPAIGPKIPDKTAAAAVTMKGDRGQKVKPYQPISDYDIGPCDLVKNKAPAFTIRIKPELNKRVFPPVGPGSYDPKLEPVKPTPPAWHLAVRYNEFTGVFRSDCDKSSYEPLDCCFD